jgi:hypothetical protein
MASPRPQSAALGRSLAVWARPNKCWQDWLVSCLQSHYGRQGAAMGRESGRSCSPSMTAKRRAVFAACITVDKKKSELLDLYPLPGERPSDIDPPKRLGYAVAIKGKWQAKPCNLGGASSASGFQNAMPPASLLGSAQKPSEQENKNGANRLILSCRKTRWRYTLGWRNAD